MIQHVTMVALGGAIGAILRYTASNILQATNFPWPTFTVNVVGSVSIGILTAIAMNYTLSQETMLFLSTGLLGAFTTMSTFSIETVGLLKAENYIIALTYATLSFCLCIIGAFAGYSLGSKLNLG